MGKTLIQKLVEARTGRPANLHEIIQLPVDLAWGSEFSLKQTIDLLRENGLLDGRYDSHLIENSPMIVFPFDHLIPTTDARSASTMVDLRDFAHRYRIRIFEVGYDGGLQHRLFEERGLLYPGTVGIGADAHSCTYGALGAIATGIGITDLAAAMLSGKSWMQVPPSIRVELSGSFKPYVSGKDLILHLLGVIGIDAANYHALEFSGPGVRKVDMASRFAVCNMAVEGGAKFGLFPTDKVTIDYLFNTVAKNFPDEVRFDPDNPDAIEQLDGDASASYNAHIEIDMESLEPQIALPFLPENTLGIHQLEYVFKHIGRFTDHHTIQNRIRNIANRLDLEGRIPVQVVFIGSCSNGRIEDLRSAAEILQGKTVNPNTRVVIIPASQQIFRQALSEGLIETFLSAGCYVESSSCGPCAGMQSSVVGRGETAIFTTNRNYTIRSGNNGSLVMLANPATAAASAITGYLTAPAPIEAYYNSEQEMLSSLEKYKTARRTYKDSLETSIFKAKVQNLKHEMEHFDEVEIEQPLVAWCFGDDIDSAKIMPTRFCNSKDSWQYKQYLLMESGNQEFLEFYEDHSYELESSVIVAGKNFGCGSSRECTAVGIRISGANCVIAHSFARPFYRNAINIGLPVFEIGDAAYSINQGDHLYCSLTTGEIINKTQGKVIKAKPVIGFQRSLIEAGGLLEFTKNSLK
jgi:3-isopropylmalate dehydratase small subunit